MNKLSRCQRKIEKLGKKWSICFLSDVQAKRRGKSKNEKISSDYQKTSTAPKNSILGPRQCLQQSQNMNTMNFR